MKAKASVQLLLIWNALIGGACYGQAPDWKVEPSAYSHSMTVVGIIKVDKQESGNASDKVAAFINGECRGVASSFYQKDLNRNLVYLLVYHNGGNEQVSFQYFAADRNQTFDSVDSFPFVVDSLAGGIDFPYVWSNVVLNSQAEITGFSFPEQSYAPQFSDSSIYVSLNGTADVTHLRADFQVSEGASSWIDLKRQVSGISTNDFSKPLKYTVLSEDGKRKKDYWIKPGIVLGVAPVAKATNFAMYPNPAEHILNVQTSSHEPLVEVQFTSVQGMHYIKTSFRKDNAALPYQIDVSDLSPGLYIMEVRNQASRGLKRIVVK